MDYLREGIHLRGYAQQDPLVAYKKEAYEMFQALLKSIQDDMVNWMFHLVIQAPRPQPVRRRIFTPVSEEGELLPTGNGHGNGHGLDPAGAAKVGVSWRSASIPKTAISCCASLGRSSCSTS